MNKLLISLAVLFTINTFNLENPIDKALEANKRGTIAKIEDTKEQCNYIRIKKYKQESEHYSIDLQIPILQNIGFNQLTQEINKRIEKKIRLLSSEIIASSKVDLKYDDSGNKYEVDSKVYIKFCNNKLLSYLVNTYEYAGGAHGNTTVFSVNVSIEDKKEVSLKDLFKEDVDYKGIIDKKIREDINEKKEEYYKNESMQFKGIKDNQEFYITDDGIVVYFQVYAIAPYVKGNPEFLFTFEEYGDMLNMNMIK